jgi:hypothetical protein
MVVTTCTQECVHCHSHANRAEAYGVSVAGVSGVSPGRGRRRFTFTEPPDRPAAAPGYDVFRHVQVGLLVPRIGARSRPAERLTEPGSLTAASIVSRRTGRRSHLTCATGVPPINHGDWIHHIFCAVGLPGDLRRLVGILCHTGDREPAVGWRTTCAPLPPRPGTIPLDPAIRGCWRGLGD